MYIGIDPLVGMEGSSTLSQSLISYLHDYGIVTLDQVYTPCSKGALGSQWFSADDLEFGGSWKVEWDAYTSSMWSLGLKLSNGPDVLKWSFNKADG